MIVGSVVAQLNRYQVDLLCQQRSLEYRPKAWSVYFPKMDEIKRNAEGTRFDRLPSNACNLILKDVKEPEEIKQRWTVSETFRDALREKYIQISLVEIVKIIMDKRPGYFYPVDKNEKVMPPILQIRGVSKLCKTSAEDFLSGNCDLAYVSFRTMEKLQEVSEKLRRNPFNALSFFPRSVQICEDGLYLNGCGDYDYELFHRSITDFLRLVGTRIHCYTYVSFQHARGKIYDCLRMWVGLLPNLEKLSVKCGEFVKPKDSYLATIPPFPYCPSLRCYQDEWTLSTRYTQRILESNPGITDLQISEDLSQREQSPLVLDAFVCGLTSLQVGPDVALIGSHHLSWRLTKLVLSKPFRKSEDNLRITSTSLFPFLGQFEDTLQHLELWIEVIDTRFQFLQLKNLKTLKWKQHKSFENLNFLVCLEKLETLHILAAEMFNTRTCRTCFAAELVGDENFFGRSIWEIFPYLKSINVVRQKQVVVRPFVFRSLKAREDNDVPPKSFPSFSNAPSDDILELERSKRNMPKVCNH